MPFSSLRGEGATCGPAYNRGRALCAAPHLHIFHPDDLLTSAYCKRDVDTSPHIIALDPLPSDECLDAFSPTHQFPLTRSEEPNTMITSDDEPSSGLNGRLRPRKSAVQSPQTTKSFRRSDGKTAQERPKRTSTPSKVLSKPDDLANKSDTSPAPYFLCPYCDKKFAAKQAISKHARRMHSSTSKHVSTMRCLFCNHAEAEPNDIVRHMVDNHPNQYFACFTCHTRFPSTTELAEHKLNICERQKVSYRNKLRQKTEKTKKPIKTIKIDDMNEFQDAKSFPTGSFNGIVISCELKPAQVHDEADIEDNITTNLILPPSKNLGSSSVLDKNAVILLDDIQWNKRIPSNFAFHNTDTDQILSRLGVVHRSPRTAESNKRDWLRTLDDATQKFEKCFDTSFYSKVASNVQENLTKFLDGSFNFNPDPDSTIKTRKWKSSVVINTAEGFPILLACEQYSRNTFDGYMPRAIAPKHKWKWDNLDSDRTALSADQIKRDSHTNNCIITLVSSLDIWTQLCMRRKYEDKYGYSPLAKKTDKQTTIEKELKEILESREIPSSSTQVVKYKYKPPLQNEDLDFPASLGLAPSTPKYELPPAVLSGEWVRPRCFVCCACGAPTSDSRALSAHMANRHPNAQVQHYEVVGELLKTDILKHLYVPPSQMHNRTRPLRGYRECTKCMKSITLEDLHQHMLDCAGDTPAVRRKCRYRPFGVRRRRPRLPDNRIRKKIRKDLRNRQSSQKSHMRARPRNRTEVGDAETIRKMLADLPAKRHRVLVNPGNSVLRPRNKLDKQRNKLLMKRRLSEDPKNRRLRVLKSTNYSEQAGSSANEDQNKSSFVNNDDDKPLKRTIKRVTTKRTRQNEAMAMKRKVALNRAKRKLKSAEQAQADSENWPDRNVPSTSGAEPDQLSIENTPQRIDVNNSSYNTRENSSRGSNGSNNPPPNNGDQPPGNMGHDGESNRSRAPVQNTPLKHSIARLTADCETHDKSVQFHHSFLVQQECNNLNQHVPTGHQLLFENEAGVTKLDKPPLASGHRGILDPYSLQKSKLNKPRKGLNDCIAMLKNKLVVEPTPGVTTSQISVQCGSDDPLDSEQLGAPSEIEDKHVDTSKPAEVFSRHNMNLEIERSYASNYEYPSENKFTSERHPVPLPYEIIPQMPSLPPGDANEKPKLEASPKLKTSATTKRQSSRRRSARAIIEAIPPFTPEVTHADAVPTKRHSGRVSQRRCATQRIVVNINTEIDKNKMLDIPPNDKMSPRQISPKQVMINTEVCKDHDINDRPPRKLSTEQISPRYSNDIHKSQSRSESLSRQVSPGRAYDALPSNKSTHKLLSLQPGIQDIDILTAIKLSPKQVSPKQVTQISPKQISLDTSSNLSSPSQQSPKQVSQSHHDIYSNHLLEKQTTPKHNDGHSSSKLAPPSHLPTRQVSQTYDSAILTPKADFSVQPCNMLASKQISPKQISQAFDILPVSKSSSSSLPSPRLASHTFDIQTSSKLSPREISPKQVSPRLVSPRQSLDINTEMTFIRSKETPSPRYANVSIESLQSEDSRAEGPSRVASHGGHSHSRASSHSRSSRSSKLRSPSQPRELASHSQVAPVFLLYAPPPPPPPPPENYVSPTSSASNHSAPTHSDTQTQQQWQTNTYHDMIRQNPPEITNEHNVTRKVSVDVYPESEFVRIPSNITPAHASTIIEPLVSVPLDLSGKPPNVESDNVSKHETSFSSNYENYETLDLSNKTSSFTKRDVTDDVVDLRIKPASQGSSLGSLELCSNASQNVNVITDLTIRERHDELIPKDLSVKTKHTVSIHTTTSKEQRYVVHGVSNQKLLQPVSAHVEESISTVEAPTDLSGKLTTIASQSGDAKYLNKESGSVPNTKQISHVTHEKHSATLPNIDYDINAPADLSDKNSKIKNPTFSCDVIKVTPQTAQETSESKDYDTFDNRNSVEKSMYESTLKIPLLKMKATTSKTPDNLHIEEVNDDIRTQASERSEDGAAIVSSLPIYTLPSLVSSSHLSRHETTKAVYTLANACISVTKIDGSGVVPFTTTLPSIPSTTIASSTPVYTLAGTTIASPVNYESKSTLGSQMSLPVVSISHQVGYENASEIKRQLSAANKSMAVNQMLKDETLNLTATNGDQDPETARKIAMLPKELVEILGTMPPGHRNQLLNVLPQYVSNINAQVEGIHTTDRLTGLSMSPAITRQSTFSENVSKYESTINYQNAMVKIPSDSRFAISNLSMPQPNENFESDVKQHFPLTSLPSSLLSTVSKSSLEDIKPSIRTSNCLSESKIDVMNLDSSETHATKPFNPTIIDLTEDDAPTNAVIKTTDGLSPSVVVSSHATQPMINLSSVSKPKSTNEKTSILRAVRIKAPSERHKSVSTEVHLSKNSQEKDAIVNNHDSEISFNKTLAIQQSEVSSTQQQQKKDAVNFSSQMSPIPTELSTGIVEPDKIQRNVSTDQNTSLDEVEDKNVAAKTVLVTSSISTNDFLTKEAVDKESLNKIVSKDVQRELESGADQDLVVRTSSNEMQDISVSDHLIESSTPLDKVSDVVEKEKIHFNKQEEEDSDDDISLAVIVKQKQLDQQSVKCSKNKVEVKKKKKDKTNKKSEKKPIENPVPFETAPTASDISTYPIDSALLIHQDKDGELNNKEPPQVQTFTTNVPLEDDDRHSKKKNRKPRRGKNLSTTTTITEIGFQKQDSHHVKVIDHNSVSSSSNKPNEKDLNDSKLNKEVEEDQKEIQAESSETVKVTMDDHNAVQKISCISLEHDDDITLYSLKKDKTSKKKATTKLLQSALPIVHKKEVNKFKDIQKSELVKQQEDSKHDCNKVIEPDSCSLIELSDTQDSLVQESFNTEDSNSEIVLESKNNKRNTRIKKSKKVEIVNDCSETPKIYESIGAPLRRSRRGKSLYVDGKTSEIESNAIESEILIEQKTPLTKKQLIFSKLLLDEENITPQAHSTPVRSIEKTEGESPITTHSSIDISSSVNETKATKHVTEKNKASKRRQSPQLKRKVKKTKSVENSQQTGEDTEIDNTIKIENHNVKTDVIPQVVQSVIETETNKLNVRKVHDIDISDQSDIIKSIEESKNRDNETCAIGKNNDHLNKLPSSAEKRKHSENSELDSSTKNKKCKYKETVNKLDIPEDITTKNDKINIKTINSTSTFPEVRTACYNKPIAAARRTRSKSAVVKSSGTLLYDPYDIDMDDMIERSEPIFIKKGKSSEAQNASSSYLANNSTPISKTPKKTSIVIDNTTGIKQSKAAIEREVTPNKESEDAVFDEDLMEDVRGSISDSDDSSKSDVPLQKYVVEKEKRMSDMDHVPRDLDDDTDIDQGELGADKNNSNDSKTSRKTLAVCNNVEEVAAQSETEEQLRSEQFMESFGFFSERKPRKSNLLASKKISETFHIIANESDDVYFGYKDRVTKKSQNENNKKSAEGESNTSKTTTTSSASKKTAKRGRKKKSCVKPVPCYCHLCKKEFKRPDNYLRHQMSLIHISKLSEVELKIKTFPVHEEPNYLIAYKQYLDRLKILTDKLNKKRKHKGSRKIKLPTVEEILTDLNKTIREQQYCHRGELSRDEALFLDCCELLKESHKNEKPNTDTSVILANSCLNQSGNDSQKQILDDTKSDGDVDSITAKTILESEEVRNLENDLISGLKEAANASLNSKMNYQHVIAVEQPQEQSDSLHSSNLREYEKVKELEVIEKPHVSEKSKRDQREFVVEEKEFVYKEKMYPDIIEDIDMFEDKFDKIKRKCRSQAAAAKQSQVVAEPNESHKVRRKSDKKKGKKTKKSHQNSHVPTKGALKGFDGIKVSIPTSDINMSAIVPPVEQTGKKKKKSTSKKKRDKKDSESSSKYDSDQRGKESTFQKKVDVYEFMDNEDAELFEFRPSTLMERFKNIISKGTPSTSKLNPVDEVEDSSESASDGDDFVYMSDDYVCSDDETENSLLSCEMGTSKLSSEPKKTTSPLKRKDAVEKNAVMGKIFKHNAVRTEKKTSKSKEPANSKANLDQLFDSLLEDEPSSSTLKSDSPRKEETESSKEYSKLPASKYEPSSSTYEAPSRESPEKEFAFPRKLGSSFHKYESIPSTSKKPQRPSLQAEEFIFTTKKYDSADDDYGPSTSKRFGNSFIEADYGPSTSKKYDMKSPEHGKAKDYGSSKYVGSSVRNEEGSYKRRYSLDKSPIRKTDEGISTSFDYGVDVFEQSYDDPGVARQRARRKCTVGKQNVLAESWSSESEPERGPPRPTSAESVLSTGGRKKKGRKKESQPIGGRRGNRPFKKQDESRVSSNRHTSSSGHDGGSYAEEYGSPGASTSVSTGVQVSLGPPPYPGPSGVKPRPPRPAPSVWAAEDEQEHLQQHGWIVGDSHKKLVTMLAHAKGRKRNSDDKRHLVE